MVCYTVDVVFSCLSLVLCGLTFLKVYWMNCDSVLNQVLDGVLLTLAVVLITLFLYWLCSHGQTRRQERPTGTTPPPSAPEPPVFSHSDGLDGRQAEQAPCTCPNGFSIQKGEENWVRVEGGWWVMVKATNRFVPDEERQQLPDEGVGKAVYG